MMKRTFAALEKKGTFKLADNWMNRGIKAAIKELLGIWLSTPRIDPKTGLSTYHPEGIGMPPETESSHFDHILEPYAQRHGLDIPTFAKKYQSGEIIEKGLDEYFVHDRAVRESGHDTTYRFEGRCANLATIDLNSLLVRYERDLAELIKQFCNGRFNSFNSRITVKIRKGADCKNFHSFLNWKAFVDDHGIKATIGDLSVWDTHWCRGLMIMDDLISISTTLNPDESTTIEYEDKDDHFTVSFPYKMFEELADFHTETINTLLWCPTTKLYYDYDTTLSMRSVYKTVTSSWAMWAGIVPQENVQDHVDALMLHFKTTGGLVSGTEACRGHITLERPNRQVFCD